MMAVFPLAVAPGWAVCVEIGGSQTGVVSGMMNMLGNLGGAISPRVVGEWLQRRGAWDLPLMTVAGCYVSPLSAGSPSIRRNGFLKSDSERFLVVLPLRRLALRSIGPKHYPLDAPRRLANCTNKSMPTPTRPSVPGSGTGIIS